VASDWYDEADAILALLPAAPIRTVGSVEELLYEHRTARERRVDGGHLELVCVCGDVLWNDTKGFAGGPLVHREGISVKDVAILHHVATVLTPANTRDVGGDLDEWADYFANYDAHVGSRLLSGSDVAKLLRGPKPFGVAQGQDTDTHWANGERRLLTPEAYERMNRAASARGEGK